MEIIPMLQQLGLSEYEARAYLALLQAPGSSGYEVAKRSGVPRAKVYEAMEALQAKGAAYTSQEGVRVLYHPVPHGTLLRRYLDRAERVVADLGPALDQLSRPGADAPLVTVRGYDAILARAEEVIAAAEERVYAVGFPEEMGRLAQAFQAAEGRGALVFAMVYGEADLGLSRTYLHDVPGIEWRLREFPHPPLTVVGDHREALMAEMAPGGSATGLWTENRGVTLIAAEYVKHDIYLAEIARRFGVQAAELFAQMQDMQKLWLR